MRLIDGRGDSYGAAPAVERGIGYGRHWGRQQCEKVLGAGGMAGRPGIT